MQSFNQPQGEKGIQTGKSPEETGILAEKPQSLVEDTQKTCFKQ